MAKVRSTSQTNVPAKVHAKATRPRADHDQVFKQLLRMFFMDFLRLFRPKLAAKLDADSIEFLPTELFTRLLTGERRGVDLLVRARFHGKSQAEHLIIHIEAQAANQADFAWRMFDYYCVLLKHFKRAPTYPIALLTFDSPKREVPSGVRVQVADLETLKFEFHPIQLNRLDWRDFIDQPNPVAAALLAKMNVAPEDAALVKLEFVRMMSKLDLEPERSRFLAGFFDRYHKLDAKRERQFEAMVEATEPQEKETIMQLVSNWEKKALRTGRKEGEAKGRKAGRKEGLVEGRSVGLVEGEMRGQARLACSLLARRLGTLEPALVKRIETLSSLGLQELGESLLDFTNLADLRRWLKARS